MSSAKLLLGAVGIVVLLSALTWGLSALGMFGNTVMERVVYENSFQYKEGMKQRVNTFQAQIAELEEMKFQNPHKAAEIDSQIRILRIQANAVQ
jgi:hypothetical protein